MADVVKKHKTIDATPTWLSVLPIYLEAYGRGNRAAKAELEYMAMLADERNQLAKKVAELEDRLSLEGWKETARQQERSGGTM